MEISISVSVEILCGELRSRYTETLRSITATGYLIPVIRWEVNHGKVSRIFVGIGDRFSDGSADRSET